MAGGLAVAAGSFLPWATVSSGLGSINVNGTQGDGTITIVIGGLIALLAVLNLDHPAGSGLRMVVTLLGLAAAGIGAFEISSLNSRFDEIDTAVLVPSIGYGLFLVIGGGIATIVGGSQMTPVEHPVAVSPPNPDGTPGPMIQAPPNYKCGKCGKPLSPAWKYKCSHCGGAYAAFPPEPR